MSDSLRQRARFARLLRADSLRADSLADSLGVLQRGGLKRVRPRDVPPNDAPDFSRRRPGRWTRTTGSGPGDVLVLILTGDVERAYTLEVTREGFVVIPQVGQVYVANLTLGAAPGPALQPARPGLLRRAARRQRRAPGSSSRSPGSATSRSTWRATWCGPAPTRSRAPARCSPRSMPPAAPPTNGSFRRVDDPPRRQAGGQPRPLRLPAARHQPDRHPAADRRRRLRAGARRLRRGGGQGQAARHLRAAARARRCATRIAFAGGFEPDAPCRPG